MIALGCICTPEVKIGLKRIKSSLLCRSSISSASGKARYLYGNIGTNMQRNDSNLSKGFFCLVIQVTSIALCCSKPFTLTPGDVRQLQIPDAGLARDEDTVTRPEPLKKHTLWELPLALVLVSVSFWENFLEQDFCMFGCRVPLNAWKKTLHEVRQRLYIWLSLGKILWSVLLAVVMVDGFSFSLSFPLESDGHHAELLLLGRVMPGDSTKCVSSLASVSDGSHPYHRRSLHFNLPTSWICPETWSPELPYHLALLSLTWISQCVLLHHIWMSKSERLAKIDKMDIDHSARSIAQKYYRIKDPDYYEYETHIFFDDAFDYSDDDEALPNSFVLRLIECLDEAISSVHERPTTMQPPERTPTVYGGRLAWTLPGGTSLVVHLKDKRKIRNRKRWSQVMYLYYLLGFNILANGEHAPEHVPEETAHAAFGKKVKLTAAQLRKRRQSAFYSRTAIFNYVTEDIQRKSESTYILTLDGDVDFKPEAVRLLVDRMKKNKKVGAACGRIHPIGTGPIVWYQQFEYAIGHWLQKATEHVFGCVLCAPGCFSLFRGSALMDDNVARMYATKSSEAGHYVQFDQGEDRWLSTLLLQQGYRIDYCAAADAYTQAPETFTEFFNQRRRWGPSTLANILDLLENDKTNALGQDWPNFTRESDLQVNEAHHFSLGDWRNVVHMNDNVSTLYIFYQTMMFVSTLLGPATVLLMMAGAYQVVFKITVFQSFLLSIVPAVGYLLLCLLARPSTQLSVAGVMSAVFAIVMTIVMVGTVGTAIQGSVTSPNVLFMVMILVIFVTSGFMHPREIGDLVPGAIYFICIPAGYLILTIYFLTNLHVVSWGTRETPVKKSRDELEKEKLDREDNQRDRDKPQSGIFGWLGLRRLVAEFGEITRQFRELLYKSPKTKKNSEALNESKPETLLQSPMESTNSLLRELIEELRQSRQSSIKPQKHLVSPTLEEMHAGNASPQPLPGLTRLSLLRNTGTDSGDHRNTQNVSHGALEQVVVTSPQVVPGTSPQVVPGTSPVQERGWASWINHPALGEGPIKVVGDRERAFWAQVMAKYLKPIQEVYF
ncbi:chitin synthase [Elysia marginata]|uniref:chitin synthase n=1 Tax=Elysia marginata TaxID=1093978 RepID=A0AAV4HBV0_9GAST|nr:chitin synthase [Elysia marginata]